MASVDQRGVSDAIAVTLMLVLLVLAGAYLHSFGFTALPAVASRQLQLQTSYLYHALELAQPENYSVSFFRAIAENLLDIGEPAVPGSVIREELSRALDFLCPPEHGARVELRFENRLWVQTVPENSAPSGDEYVFSGTVTLVIAEAENHVAQVEARVSLYPL